MAQGFRFLSLNFSHNGIGADPLNFTEGDKFRENTFSLEVEEAREVVAAFRAGALCNMASEAKIGVLGHSRGGGIALLSMYDRSEVSAICTWAAVSTFFRYPEETIQLWEQQGYLDIKNSRTGQVMQLGWNLHADLVAKGQPGGPLNVQSATQNLQKPLCVIHGDEDPAVVVKDAHDIASWAQGAHCEKHIIAGAGHTFGARHPFTGSNPQAFRFACGRWLGANIDDGSTERYMVG
ncbi:MAG: prolyl oligopeptidase family serine peptidase, partial [Bacteroidota bacterium]